MSTQLETKLNQSNHGLTAEPVSFETDKALTQWLESQAQKHHLSYLLAHAIDGVIWGRFDNGKLETAEVPFSEAKLPALRHTTLQQCWIFGEAGELFLWHSGQNEWRSRHISSEWEQPYINSHDCIEETQLLWGTHAVQQDGFTLLRDGSQGLKHAIPTTADITFDSPESDKITSYPRLKVRHYITYDPDDGLARIFLSRLVDFVSQK